MRRVRGICYNGGSALLGDIRAVNGEPIPTLTLGESGVIVRMLGMGMEKRESRTIQKTSHATQCSNGFAIDSWIKNLSMTLVRLSFGL